MKHIIVDSGKMGWAGKYKRRSRFWQKIEQDDWEDAPHTERMFEPSRRGIDSCKTQSDYLNPFKRFLKSRLGRLWNDVYSEICEHANPNSIRGYHVRQHIEDFVELTAVEHEGEVCLYEINRFVPVDQARTYRPFYVHPRTGRLCQKDHKKSRMELARRKKKQQHNKVTRLPWSHNVQAHKIDGVWYKVIVAPLFRKVPDPNKKMRDVLLDIELNESLDVARYMNSWYLESLYKTYGLNQRLAHQYGVAKFQMSKQESEEAEALAEIEQRHLDAQDKIAA